jgi:glycosyltransferase involved in cell wall biosynthesis
MTTSGSWLLTPSFRIPSQRKRILFVIPTLSGGGLERAAVTLLRHLDRSRFEPHLALLAAIGPYLNDVPEDVPIHDLKTFRVRRSIPAIVRLVRKLRPDIVLSTPREVSVAMAFVRPWLPKDLRLLVQEQNCATEELAEKSSHPGIWRWLYRTFYARADKIICVADYLLNDLAEHYGVPRSKMLRIYNPVDTDMIRQQADAAANPYSGPGPHLVAAGRLTRQKGFDLLLEAMALVHATVPLARLTILGQGPLEGELKQQRERLGLTETVRFDGFQCNPYPHFKHADLFVLSSRYEGLPVVVLEALACRTPIVATDCPGGTREILAGSEIGILVPNSDPLPLAKVIITACQTAREGRSKAARLEEQLNRFRIEQIVRAYEDLLLSLR